MASQLVDVCWPLPGPGPVLGVVGGMRVTLRLPGVRSSSAVSRRCRAPRCEGAVRVQRHQSAVRPAQQFPAAWPRDLQCRPQDGSSPPPCCPSSLRMDEGPGLACPHLPGAAGPRAPPPGRAGGQWGQLGVAGTAHLLQLFAGAARHGTATSPPLPECMEAPTMPLSPALVPTPGPVSPTISISRRPGPKGHRPGHPPSKSPPHPTHGSP